jgi:hypothetical protein
MNAHDDFIAKYTHHNAQLRKANLANKAIVFDALQSAGITSVHVEFDGVGDSGQIDNVTGYDTAGVVALPSVTVTLHQVSYDGSELPNVTHQLQEAIEVLCYDYLEQEHDGWEINDGAYGTFTFDVPQRTMELEFNGRFTDVATSHHKF